MSKSSSTLSTMSGKAGEWIFYTVNGQQRIRRAPQRVKQPNSPRQLVQRARMRYVADLAQAFMPVLRSGYSRGGTNCYFYNAFIRDNIGRVEVDEQSMVCTLGAGALMCARGEMTVWPLQGQYVADKRAVELHLPPGHSAGGREDCVVVFHDPQMPRVAVERFTWPQNTERVTVAFPHDFEPQHTSMYSFRALKDDSNCSNSVYVPLQINP